MSAIIIRPHNNKNPSTTVAPCSTSISSLPRAQFHLYIVQRRNLRIARVRRCALMAFVCRRRALTPTMATATACAALLLCAAAFTHAGALAPPPTSLNVEHLEVRTPEAASLAHAMHQGAVIDRLGRALEHTPRKQRSSGDRLGPAFKHQKRRHSISGYCTPRKPRGTF